MGRASDRRPRQRRVGRGLWLAGGSVARAHVRAGPPVVVVNEPASATRGEHLDVIDKDDLAVAAAEAAGDDLNGGLAHEVAEVVGDAVVVVDAVEGELDVVDRGGDRRPVKAELRGVHAGAVVGDHGGVEGVKRGAPFARDDADEFAEDQQDRARRSVMNRQWGGIVDTTPDACPIISKTKVAGLYFNCGWGTGGFKATPGSGNVFAHTIAHDAPHPLNAAFSLDRFHSGHLIDEHGAAGVAH